MGLGNFKGGIFRGRDGGRRGDRAGADVRRARGVSPRSGGELGVCTWDKAVDTVVGALPIRPVYARPTYRHYAWYLHCWDMRLLY